jgi:type II secretory pathway component PulC
MGRLFALGLGFSTLSYTLVAAAVPPGNTQIETASLVLRAWGKYGEVKRVKSDSADKRSLPREVKAGSIPRTALVAELSGGIGRFLQHVHTEPVFNTQGQFKGWRLLSLFAKRSDVDVQVLRVGDVLLRINGQSVERPEEFKAAWDAMGNAKELVLDIERDGRETRLRYSITP